MVALIWIIIGSGTGLLSETPSHYLSQSIQNISVVLWHLPEGKFIGNTQDIYPWLDFENY